MSGKLKDKVLCVLRDNKRDHGLFLTIDEIARRVGYRPVASGRLACWKALEALRLEEKADYYRSRPDRWGVMLWGAIGK